MLPAELAALYARDLTRLIEEVRAFPDRDALWKTAPGVTNSAGNLTLHLEGNLREYIGRQLGSVAYTRERPLEFSQNGFSAVDLAARVAQLRDLVTRIVSSIPPETLDATYPEAVLGVTLTTRQFLLHLYGHLNYHLGQIDYLRRFTTGAGAIHLSGL
jgi:hypothetical protein